MLTYPFQIFKKLLTDKVSELREIDWYLQQDSESDKNAWLYAAPVVFIEFLPYETMDLGKRIQHAIVEFNLHLLTSNVQDSGKRMSKTQPTDHMRIFDKVYDAVHGFSALLSYLPEFVALADTASDQRVMNSCSRIQIVPPHVPRKSLMKSTQRFKTVLFDHGAVKVMSSPTPPGPDLQVTVELP